MDERLEKALRNWIDAKVKVAFNNRIMVSNPTDDQSGYCKEGLRELEEAEKSLYAFKMYHNLPKPIKHLFKITENKEYSNCRFSSNSDIHPDFREKTANYFDAVDSLYWYGLGLFYGDKNYE